MAKQISIPARLKNDPDFRFIEGLSVPSKMPGFGYSLPAKKCHTGTKLRAVKGSTCHKCYAMKNRYTSTTVQNALQRRWTVVTSDLAGWTAAMIRLLPKAVDYTSTLTETADRVFRWHDSGDIQSPEHFGAIVAIARACADIRFWIPTREYGFVRQFLEMGGTVPANLTVRMSNPMVGMAPAISERVAAQGIQSSTVGFGSNGSRLDQIVEAIAAREAGTTTTCESRTRGNYCGPCRACWSKDIPNVDYPLH